MDTQQFPDGQTIWILSVETTGKRMHYIAVKGNLWEAAAYRDRVTRYGFVSKGDNGEDERFFPDQITSINLKERTHGEQPNEC